MNQDAERMAHRTLDCDLKQVIELLARFKPQLDSMAVESTFNCNEWFVDCAHRTAPSN